MYRRGGIYYCQNNETGKQESLHTGDKAEARRLLNAKNEALKMGTFNLHIARAYMVAVDPQMPNRTWKDVIRYIIDEKTGPNQKRWETVEKDKSLRGLWNLRVVESRADQLLTMVQKGTVSTNVYLRRLHNYTLDMNWLAWPIVPKKKWPKIVYPEKRGITLEEHQKIIARETNPERRDYYELLWYLGGSQTDVASLHAEDVNWTDCTVFYRRKKNGKDALQHFGDKTAKVLGRRPMTGPLFPYLCIDLEAKREALAKAKPLLKGRRHSSKWRQDQNLIKWLSSL
jgi:hypothetical protein